MPSVQPPDSPTRSGSTEFCSEGTEFAAASELLPEFASEAPQPSHARGASPGARVMRNDFTLAAKRAPTTPIWLESARRLPPRPPASTHRTRKLWNSLKTRILYIPVWMKQVPNVRRLAATTTLTSFGVGSAAGAIIMWFAGAQTASYAVPSPQMPPAQTTLALPEVPASSPDRPLQTGNIQAVLASEPASTVATATREVGTSGRAAREVNTVRTRPAVTEAPATPARRAAARPAAYRGSLAFRSAPQGARVFLNGQFVGSTPLVLEDLPVGSRAVRIEADGYQRWSASTQVVANQQTRVSATLGPAAP